MRATVITPYFEEGETIRHFVERLASVPLPGVTVDLVVVDDASYRRPAADFLPSHPLPFDVRVLTLPANVGHQAALAQGLEYALDDADVEVFLLVDSDGEDDLAAVPLLLSQLASENIDIAVATRGKRSESLNFRAAYLAHRALFRLATGQTLNFGNFMALRRPAAAYLIRQPSVGTHIAATVLRSRFSLSRVGVDRQVRFSGKSKMSATSLLRHSLASLSVYLDRIFPRVLLVSFTGIGILLALLGTVFAVRLFTDLGVPGWATYTAGILLLGAFQLLSLLALLTVLSILATQNRYRSVAPNEWQTNE